MKSKINIGKTASTIWKGLQMGDEINHLNIEFEKHKEIFSFFQVGDYYYFIVNLLENKFEYVSEGFHKLLGHDSSTLTLPSFLEKIHPEDQPWFLNMESKVIEFFAQLKPEQIPNYKVRYDYRIRHKEGHYIRILQQVITLAYSNEGGLFRTLALHTDISHIKSEGNPVLSFIGLNGAPSYINVNIKEIFATSSTLLTQREKEVVMLLIEGKDSKNIASILGISIDTVSTHRKRILAKTNSLNTADLVIKSIKNGWI
jgi:DNA-binding CsgD family transcriptional regulator